MPFPSCWCEAYFTPAIPVNILCTFTDQCMTLVIHVQPAMKLQPIMIRKKNPMKKQISSRYYRGLKKDIQNPHEEKFDFDNSELFYAAKIQQMSHCRLFVLMEAKTL